ncbi:MAG TPA: kelch repeat-containing protein, partial [Blastocatellia bacterium]|nr:kelch repeat-containing protein [Blastocatellia bacterium]
MRRRRLTLALITLVLFSLALTGSLTVSSAPEKTQERNLSAVAAEENLHNAVEMAARKAVEKGKDLRSLSLSVPRRGHTATPLPDGKVLIVGGENESGPVREVELLDPVSRTSLVTGFLEVARSQHTATALPDHTVLITGGSNKSGALSSTEIFDSKTGSIFPGPGLNRTRSGHSATLLADGNVLVAGGRRDGTAEILDTRGARFSLLATRMTTPRRMHGAALLRDGSVLLVGGLDREGKPLDTAEVFSSANTGFTETFNWMEAKRIRPVIRQLSDDKVQVIGGDKAGTMEIYNAEGRFFRSNAALPITSDMFTASTMLLAQTRTAFIDRVHAGASKRVKQTGSLSPALNSSDIPLDLTDYSATDIPGTDMAVIAGGSDGAGRTVGSAIITRTSRATVTTDRIEYLPDWKPTISGSGWGPFERVLVVRQQVMGQRRRVTLRSVTDAQGNFTNDQLTAADQEMGAYILTAFGESSGNVAQTSFVSAPPFDPRFAHIKKPLRIKFTIPADGRSGSIDTELGKLKWKPKAGAGSLTPAAGAGVSFPACLNFGPVSLCDASLSFEILSSHFNFNVTVGGSITFDPGCFDPTEMLCSPFRLPSLSASVQLDQSLDAGVVFQITGSGEVEVSGIVLPLFPPIDFEIGSTGIGGEISAGLKAGVKLNIEPTTVQFSFDVDESVTVGASVSTSSGFDGNATVNSSDFDAGVQMIQLGESCLTFFMGPEVAVSLSLGAVEGEASAIIDGFIEGCLIPTNTPDCVKFDATIDGGIEGGISASFTAGDLSVGGDLLEGEIFRENIATFTEASKDTLPPTISTSNIVTTTAPGQCSRAVTFTPDAADTCSGLASVVCFPPSNSNFFKGTTLVNCKATDRKGLTATSSFNVTVNDTESPVFASPPGNLTRPTDPGKCSAAVSFTAPQATDNCPGVSVICAPPSGTVFAKGTTKVTCTATDAVLHQTNTSFMVTVADQEPPKLTSTAYGQIATGTSSGVVNFNPATDNCPGMNVVCMPPSGSVFPVGVTNISCTATDAASNATSATLKLVVFNIVAMDDNSKSLLRAVWTGGNTASYEFLDCSKGLSLSGN